MQLEDDLREPLLNAIARSDIEAALSLIDKGADISIVSPNGWTPLMLSAMYDLRDVAQALLSRGADPNQRTSSWENPSRTVLLVAINNARAEILKLLLQWGVDAQAPVHGSTPALEWARRQKRRNYNQDSMAEVVHLLESSRPS